MGFADSESDRFSGKKNKKTDNFPNKSAENQIETSGDKSGFHGNSTLIQVDSRDISAARVPLVCLSDIYTEDDKKFGDESLAKRAENDENQCKAKLNIVSDDFALLKKSPTNDRPLQRNSFLAENAQLKEGLRKKILQALEGDLS